MSYVSSLYHIVFSTYRRQQTINNENRHHLYAILANEIQSEKCKAYIINGVRDHVHILMSLHQDVALSSLVRNLKSKSTVWAKSSGLFPMFEGWEKEYGAFSLSDTHKDAVYQYIMNQQVHHNSYTSDEEYRKLVSKAGLKFFEQGNV